MNQVLRGRFEIVFHDMNDIDDNSFSLFTSNSTVTLQSPDFLSNLPAAARDLCEVRPVPMQTLFPPQL
jgi:hypothetical protein